MITYSGGWMNIESVVEQLGCFRISFLYQLISHANNLWFCLLSKICCKMSASSINDSFLQNCDHQSNVFSLYWIQFLSKETRKSNCENHCFLAFTCRYEHQIKSISIFFFITYLSDQESKDSKYIHIEVIFS